MKAPGWYPDFARWIFHLTDKRILVESYEWSMTEKLAHKAIFALAGTLAGHAPMGDFQLAEAKTRTMEMPDKPAEWFAVAHTEIARVERLDFHNFGQKFATKLFGRYMVRIVFKDAARKPFVCDAQACQASYVTIKRFDKEFIDVMGQLLGKVKELEREDRVTSRPPPLPIPRRIAEEAALDEHNDQEVAIAPATTARPVAAKGDTARSQEEDDRDEDFEDRPRRKKARSRQRTSPLLLGGLIGGGLIGGGLIFIVLVVVVVILLPGEGETGHGEDRRAQAETARAQAEAFSQHEAAITEALGLTADSVNALKEVKDVKGLSPAAVKMNQICDRLEALRKKVRNLPKISQAEQGQLEQKFQSQMDDLHQDWDNADRKTWDHLNGHPSYHAARRRFIVDLHGGLPRSSVDWEDWWSGRF